MSSTSQIQSGSRPGRLARSRSQRVVRVLQTSNHEGIISKVNDDSDDPSNCVEQPFSFLDLCDEESDRRDEIDDLASELRKAFKDVEDEFSESRSQSITITRDIVVEDDSTPVFFDANTDDGSVYSFYPAEEDDNDHAKGASADLFSDDEFTAINMNFQKRPKKPVHVPSRINVHVNKSLPPSPRTSHYEHSTYEESLFSVEAESMSGTTLYSLGSTTSSATCVSQERIAKAGSCNVDFPYDVTLGKRPEVTFPPSEIVSCDEISLEKMGYGFGCNRFDPRSKVMRDMTLDPIDFKQYALSRGPNAFPVPDTCRPKLRSTKSNLEKRLIGVFKQKRVA